MGDKADAARAARNAVYEKRLERMRLSGRRQGDLRLLMHPKNVERRAEGVERSGAVLRARIDELEERLEKLEKAADHGPPR